MTAVRTACPPLMNAMACALALAGASAHALEFGPERTLSGLGQPLHVRLAVTGPGSERRLQTAVRCLEGDCGRLMLRSFIAGRGQNRPTLVVRSFTPVQGPRLRVEVEVSDGERRLRRELNLDLGAATNADRATTEATRATQEPAAGGRSVFPSPPGRRWREAPDEGESALEGHRAQVAGQGTERALSDAPAQEERHAAPRQRAAPRAPAALPAASGNDTQAGTAAWVVQPGETLSGIAAALSRRHGGGTGLWMERLHTGNPAAFQRGDRDRLRAGAVLSYLPPEGAAAPAPRPSGDADRAGAPAAPPASPSPAPTAYAPLQPREETRQSLARLADEGAALAARLTKLEARMRALEAGFAGSEAALTEASARLERVEHEALREAPADRPVEAPAAAAHVAAPPAPVPVSAVGPVALPPARMQDTASGPQPGAVSDGLRVGWLLGLTTGFLLLVLVTALLLRGLARPTGRPQRRQSGDDSTLRQQIRERLSTRTTDARPASVEVEEVIDPGLLARPTPLPPTLRAPAPAPAPAAITPEATSGEDEIVTEVDVKIVYGLFDEAEAVLVEALRRTPGSARLLLKLGEVRFYRRDADALVSLAERVLADGHRQPAWLWAKVERLGRELCPDRAPFSSEQPGRRLQSVG